MTKKTYYIALDGEFSGPRVNKHYMIQLGAAFFDGVSMAPLDTFQVDMNQPLDREFDADTLAWWSNKDSPRYEQRQDLIDRSRNGKCVDARTAMQQFVEWIYKCAKSISFPENALVFVTDTAGSDVKWIDYYLAFYADHNPLDLFFAAYLGQSYWCDTVSVDMFALGVAKITPTLRNQKRAKQAWSTCEDAAFNALGVNSMAIASRTPHDHEARSDATHIGQTFFLICNEIEQGSA